MFTARWIVGLAQATPCLRLREDVFVKELGQPREAQLDWYDGIAAHLLVLELPDGQPMEEAQGEPVAAARMYPDGADTRIDSICVRAGRRGMRYGDLCTRMLLYKAQQLVPARILARVPEGMAPYYAGFGFAPLAAPSGGYVELCVARDAVVWDSMCRHGTPEARQNEK